MVKRVFTAIDVDGSGYLTHKELAAALKPEAVKELRAKLQLMYRGGGLEST